MYRKVLDNKAMYKNYVYNRRSSVLETVIAVFTSAGYIAIWSSFSGSVLLASLFNCCK